MAETLSKELLKVPSIQVYIDQADEQQKYQLNYVTVRWQKGFCR